MRRVAMRRNLGSLDVSDPMTFQPRPMPPSKVYGDPSRLGS
ncbi:MAG: hypothetical protein QOD07_2368 [Frankiaceae bacterium]|nr:hypothetical protein [Frankiaceae bacterium]